MSINDMKSKIVVLLLIFCWIPSFCGCTKKVQNHSSNIVRIGTFNIAWLGDGINDKILRSEHDYKNIADVIQQADADILGIEEIENQVAFARILKYLPGYKFYVGTHGGSQNIGVIYREDISVKYDQEYMQIAVDFHKTRPGLVLSCRKGNFDWKMMVVHLKSSSSHDSTAKMQADARQTRIIQAEICSQWVDSTLKSSDEKDIFIVGDFNDFPKRKINPTLTSLVVNSELEFLTFESKSCKNDQWSGIDHIVCSKSAKKRFITGSDHSINFYAEMTKNEADKVSDHCPVLVDFDISAPDND
ncbi:MAG: endonuclease/exonuclease/phosphatase family protein [Ignavibacteriae bacterium]|nr:endonuclease/exonuclease/phosphatase family protein [Ignavibacteriota bacterium]